MISQKGLKKLFAFYKKEEGYFVDDATKIFINLDTKAILTTFPLIVEVFPIPCFIAILFVVTGAHLTIFETQQMTDKLQNAKIFRGKGNHRFLTNFLKIIYS